MEKIIYNINTINPFHFNDEFERTIQTSSCDMHHWLKILSHCTIRTTFLPISRIECEALFRSYSKSHSVDDEILEVLTSKIEIAISKHCEEISFTAGPRLSNDGVFIRLTTQSPKDVGWKNIEFPRLEEIVQDEYKCVGYKNDSNNQMRALMHASIRIMQVTDAKYAMDLLKQSLRIRKSLGQILSDDTFNSEEKWDLKLVIRDWLSDLSLDKEFRCFVCNDRLTAISQYNDRVCYTELEKEETVIRQANAIVNFFEEHVKGRLPKTPVGDSFVLDFAVFDHVSDSEIPPDVIVIEINPFGCISGPALFHWEKDRVLLQGGYDKWGDLYTPETWNIKHSDPYLDECFREITIKDGEGKPVSVRTLVKPNKEITHDTVLEMPSHIFLVAPLKYDDNEEYKTEENRLNEEKAEELFEKLLEENKDGIFNDDIITKKEREEFITICITYINIMDDKNILHALQTCIGAYWDYKNGILF